MSEKNPVQVRSSRRGKKWCVEVSITYRKKKRHVTILTPTKAASEELVVKLRRRFKRTLKYVAE